MQQPTYPKRLIEVDLPIKRISAHARREKSIRHGHISTLHIWWARRPLAACRAVLCAALWPDPADPLCPQAFRDSATELITAFASKAATNKALSQHCSQDIWSTWQALARPENRLDPTRDNHLNILRHALLDFIADFANWDNSTQPDYLQTARALTQAAHEALGGLPGTRPLVVDPFAGGGSIPLEALRVGADTFASDLNPIPVLINKVQLEYIPKFRSRLAEEVRRWGDWIKQEAEKQLKQFYPEDDDGSVPIAYIWARTIRCEGPGCGAEVPLMRSMWLAMKNGRNVALRMIPNRQAKRVDFEIVENIEPAKMQEGTVKRGNATCPVCGFTTPVASVRRQMKTKQGGADNARLVCVVTTNPKSRGRTYRLPQEKDVEAILEAKEELEKRIRVAENEISIIPDESTPAPNGHRAVSSAQIYGFQTFGDFFSSRQLLALTTLVDLVKQAGEELREQNGKELAGAMQTCLSFSIDKIADLGNSLNRWEPVAECVRQLFGRQAIPMVWDFGETVPISDSSGSTTVMTSRFATVLENIGSNWATGEITSGNAVNHPLPDDSAQVFFTDPPYYDAVPYADLSDFFYVWLKRTLKEIHPNLFREIKTKNKEQIVVWHPNSKEEKNEFELEMQKAMAEGRRVSRPEGIGIVVFAHKSTAGWEAQLQSMLQAGWMFTASWPIDTEMGSRMNAMGTASLASSIHLVCRPRENPDGSLRQDVGDWREVLQELPQRIHEWLPRMAAEGIVGADAIFACLGPALEIFSRYARVEKTSGEQVTLEEYLEHVWAAVAKEALNMIFEGADTMGFEEDARLTAMWLWTLSTEVNGKGENGTKVVKSTGYTLEYDAARKIAQGLGVHMEKLDHLVEIKGDKARLLPVAERSRYLFGKEDSPAAARKTKQQSAQTSLLDAVEESEEGPGWHVEGVPAAGQTALDKVHQSMLLFAGGRSEALKRFLVEEGVGRDARFWQLAQSLSALYPSHTEEKRWVDGVLARKKSLGF